MFGEDMDNHNWTQSVYTFKRKQFRKQTKTNCIAMKFEFFQPTDIVFGGRAI